jgi:hypothetical protein
VSITLYFEGARVAQWVRSLDLTTHTIPSPIRRGFASSFVNYTKGCTRLAAASDKVYQLLAHGRWFSPCTLASSTTKTGRHDIAEILLKVALNTKYSNSFKFTIFRYISISIITQQVTVVNFWLSCLDPLAILFRPFGCPFGFLVETLWLSCLNPLAIPFRPFGYPV